MNNNLIASTPRFPLQTVVQSHTSEGRSSATVPTSRSLLEHPWKLCAQTSPANPHPPCLLPPTRTSSPPGGGLGFTLPRLSSAPPYPTSCRSHRPRTSHGPRCPFSGLRQQLPRSRPPSGSPPAPLPPPQLWQLYLASCP